LHDPAAPFSEPCFGALGVCLNKLSSMPPPTAFRRLSRAVFLFSCLGNSRPPPSLDVIASLCLAETRAETVVLPPVARAEHCSWPYCFFATPLFSHKGFFDVTWGPSPTNNFPPLPINPFRFFPPLVILLYYFNCPFFPPRVGRQRGVPGVAG